MSFADELRAHNPGSRENGARNAEIEKTANFIFAQIKAVCEFQANKGKTSFSGYLRKYYDDGFTHIDFADELPTVSQCEENAKEKTSQKWTAGRIKANSLASEEKSLYSDAGLCFTNSLDMINEYKKLLDDKLGTLGFSDYSITVVRLDEVTVLENKKESPWTGRIKYTVSTSNANKVYYTLKIETSW